MKPRALILALGLVGSVGWSAWILTTPRDEVVLAKGTAPRSPTDSYRGERTPPPLRPLPSHDLLSARGLDLEARPPAPVRPHNLFGTYTYEAPRPAPVAIAPQPPHAPPLPFVYTGQLVVDGRATYLLLQSGVPISVTVGNDVGEYKLVEASADRLIFLHGPTGQQLAMSLAGKPLN